MKHIKLVALLIALPSVLIAHTARPDFHAPMGVMADHTHNMGEWMLSARYKSMSMANLQKGGTDISQDSFFEDTSYMMAPKEMSMEMYMIGGMTAITDTITLAAMVPFVQKEMTMTSAMSGLDMTNETSGIGDPKITALFKLDTKDHSFANWFTSISLPFGSITEEKDGSRLGYGLQLGSGSPDITNGISYKALTSSGSFGLQFVSVLRPFKNKEGYALGDEVTFTAWKSYLLSPAFSTSLRSTLNAWTGLKGQSSEISAMRSPQSNGGERLSLAWGLNFIQPSGTFKGHRIGTEISVPVHERTSHYSLTQEWAATLAWQYTL